MFSNLMALDSEAHRGLRLKPQGFGFAAAAMTAPLCGSEFVEAAKHFPIVFPVDGCEPQALLSLRNDGNAFVAADNRWTVPFVPAHLRRHPFILSRKEKDTQALVLIDRDAPSLSDQDGERLFDDGGNARPVLTQIIAFLRDLQAEFDATRALMTALEPVLVERQIEVEVPGQPKQMLDGFRAVDVDKLTAMPDDTIVTWHRNGLLPLVYTHLASMSNVQHLAELQARSA